MLEDFQETVNKACKSGSVLPNWRMNTPRACFTRSIRAMLEGVTQEREMKGWELRGRPDLLPDDEVDELDDDIGLEDL